MLRSISHADRRRELGQDPGTALSCLHRIPEILHALTLGTHPPHGMPGVLGSSAWGVRISCLWVCSSQLPLYCRVLALCLPWWLLGAVGARSLVVWDRHQEVRLD